MTDALFAVEQQAALTPRQQQAVAFIAEHDGVTADEIGAHLHAHRERRPHSVDERCRWCAKDGLHTVRSKAVAPLVTYRRNPRAGRLYVLRGHTRSLGPRTAPGWQAFIDATGGEW